MSENGRGMLVQIGYDVDALEASTTRAVGVMDAGTGKMVTRAQAAARQINSEFGKVSADGVRASMKQVAELQDHLVDAAKAGEKAIASALRAEIDVRERVQRAAVAQLDTQMAIAKASGNSAQVKELQQVLSLYQQVQKQRAVGVTGTAGLTGAASTVQALSGGGGHGGDGGLNRMQMMELGHSARATFDALAAGASPMRVLAMEGPRVVQALGSGTGGVGGVLKGLMSAVSPTVLILGALGAALAAGVISAVQYAQGVHEIIKAVDGLGRASGVTEGQIEDLAQAQAKSGKVSQGAAQALAIAMITTGKVTRENLAGATGVVEEFAEVTKTKLADATKIMAKAFEDPAKGAKELTETYGLLSGAEIEEIERLQDRGDKTAALTRLIDAMKVSLDQASGGLKAHAEGWEAIANAAKDAWTNIGKAIAVSAGQGSLGARIADLEHKRAAILPGPAGDQVRASVDRELATLKAEQAKQDARTEANAKEAQANQKSLSVAEAAKALAKKDTEIDTIHGRQKDLRDALADPKLLQKSGLTRAQAEHAISEGDKQIAQIRNRGVPADQTLSLDKAAHDAEATQSKALLDAQAALITGIHDHAEAEKKSVDEALERLTNAKKTGDLDLEEQKIRESKNNAHKAEQLAAIDKAKTEAKNAALARKELIDRQAAEAALAQAIQTRDFVQAQRSRIAGNDAAQATTRAERNAIERASLLEQQQTARRDFDAETARDSKGKSTQIDPSSGNFESDLDAYLRNRNAQRDALVAGQKSDLDVKDFNAAGPIDQYLRSIKDLDTTLQNDAVDGIRSFDQAIMNAAANTKDAGRILENWLLSTVMRVAEHEFEAQAGPALVSLGTKALSLFGLGLAGGGPVSGPGSSTSDSIPIWASDGEYMINASAARRVGRPMLDAINSGKPLKFAQGGMIGRQGFPLLNMVSNMRPMAPNGVTVIQPLILHAEGAIMADEFAKGLNAQAARMAHAAAVAAVRTSQAGLPAALRSHALLKQP